MTDLDKYAAWTAVNVDVVYGRCREAAERIVSTFPELRMVPGHIEDALWGRRAHWWCVGPDGTIVDPTAAQFPALLDYEPFVPGSRVRTGVCMNCGTDLWSEVQSLEAPPPRRTSCSDLCSRELGEYYNGR